MSQQPTLDKLFQELKSAALDPRGEKDLRNISKQIREATAWHRAPEDSPGGRPPKKLLIFEMIARSLNKSASRSKALRQADLARIVNDNMPKLIEGWKSTKKQAEKNCEQIRQEIAASGTRRLTLKTKQEAGKAVGAAKNLARKLELAEAVIKNCDVHLTKDIKADTDELDRKTVEKYARLWLLEQKDWLDLTVKEWGFLAKDDPDYVHRAYFLFKTIHDLTPPDKTTKAGEAYGRIVDALRSFRQPFYAPGYYLPIRLS